MNDAHPQRPKSKWRWVRIFTTIVVCLAILGGSVAAVVVINRTEPTAEQISATRKSKALVETITVQRGTYSPRLKVLGTVRPAKEIVLSPRVSGQILELSPNFVPGGMVRKGELLLRIDPADFENALSIRVSEQQQAEASREIEQARQRLARKELTMLEGTVDDTNRALVLREPQIASIEAEVAAAKAAVERAKLDLARTNVYAPFDAQVLTRSVNVGSQVATGDELGQLVGLKEFWIMAAVPVRSLRWVQFPKVDRLSQSERISSTIERLYHPFQRIPNLELLFRWLQSQSKSDSQNDETEGDESVDGTRGERVDDATADERVNGQDGSTEDAIGDNRSTAETQGSKVILRNRDAWGPSVKREAQVARMIGALDEETRLARVLISVKDPLGMNSNVQPLILDTLIETEIIGRPIPDVVRLPREFVRDQDTVWVMKDGKLDIRETEIVFRDSEYAYIREGLESGDEVVTTTLATVAEGVGLRKVDETTDSSSPPGEGTPE